MRPQDNEPCMYCKHCGKHRTCELNRYDSPALSIFGTCSFLEPSVSLNSQGEVISNGKVIGTWQKEYKDSFMRYTGGVMVVFADVTICGKRFREYDYSRNKLRRHLANIIKHPSESRESFLIEHGELEPLKDIVEPKTEQVMKAEIKTERSLGEKYYKLHYNEIVEYIVTCIDARRIARLDPKTGETTIHDHVTYTMTSRKDATREEVTEEEFGNRFYPNITAITRSLLDAYEKTYGADTESGK